MKNVVGIVYSDEYRRLCCTSPKFTDRFALVMDLINAYGLIGDLARIPPLEWISKEEVYRNVSVFHSSDYIEALDLLEQCSVGKTENNGSISDEEQEQLFDSFGLNYDCPGFPNVFKYAVATVRGTLAAAEALINRQCKVAINWAGGWHHARRDAASGFCYLNDIVLAISRLSVHNPDQTDATRSNRLLYIDLDLHHGDGVEEAFYYSSRVVTFSVHHASLGFFPGSGNWACDSHTNSDEHHQTSFPSGSGRGRFAAFNLPLDKGINDELWCKATGPVLDVLHSLVKPSYVIVQCGADCLSTDPHLIFHLTNSNAPPSCPPSPPLSSSPPNTSDSRSTTSGYWFCLERILSWNVPTLILGGGGYNFSDTARLWTKLTALAIERTKDVKIELPSEIPQHSYLSRYGPDYDLDITSLPYNTDNKVIGNLRDQITRHHARLFKQACDYATFNEISFDPDEIENYFNL